jgi:hypothetical protein
MELFSAKIILITLEDFEKDIVDNFFITEVYESNVIHVTNQKIHTISTF